MRDRTLLTGCGATMSLLGALVVSWAIYTSSQPQATAVPVLVTVESDLSRTACQSGQTMRVEFQWKGARTEQNYFPDCRREYRSGESIPAFALSDNPSELGLTADQILHPDEHDPFDFIGPNGLPIFAAMASVPLLGGGVALIVAGLLTGRWQKPGAVRTPSRYT